MKNISIFIGTFLIIGFFFLALPEKGYSGFPTLPGGPPCCEVTFQGTCVGGDPTAMTACGSQGCLAGGCTLFNNAICVEGGQGSGNCIADTSPPTLIPSTSVPTISGWGFLSLAVVLVLIGLGAIMARRKKASS